MKNPLRVLIAVDSFKGTLSSKECAETIEKGILSVFSDIKISKVAIADGGEGTVESIIEGLGGKYISVEVKDPLFRTINATYGVLRDGNTSIIEMASASGLSLLKNKERNPLLTSTYGTGELILDSINNGAKNIIIGVGGSSTNDGGIGMASALGIKFLDNDGLLIRADGGSLKNLEHINISDKYKKLNGVRITVLCDVNNPLYGKKGASYIYASQKGASEENVKILNENLLNLSRVVKKDLNKFLEDYSGAGAAGGLGYGLMVFLDAQLRGGIQFIIDFLKLEEKIQKADLIITGEGKLDSQTSCNKAPWGIMKLAKKYNKKVIGLAGIIESNYESILRKNFDYLYSVVNDNVTQQQSESNPKYYLNALAKKIATDILVEYQK